MMDCLARIPERKPVTIQTKCKDCIFAIYDPVKNKSTWPKPLIQSPEGCKFGRLEKYFKQGNIQWNEEEGRTFAVIENRVCNTYTKEMKPDENLDQAIIRIRNNVKIR